MKLSEMNQILCYILADFDATPTEEKTRVWHDQCKHLDPNFAMEAAKVLMREEHYTIPRVSQFLRVVDDMTKTPSDRMTWGEAWEIALDTARKFGVGRSSAAFLEIRQHERLVKTIRQIGWQNICMVETKELPYMRNTFKDFYESLRERDNSDKKIVGNIGADVKQLVGSTALALSAPEAHEKKKLKVKTKN